MTDQSGNAAGAGGQFEPPPTPSENEPQVPPVYSPPEAGYPPPQAGYPPREAGYPPSQAGYPPSQAGYPPPAQPGAFVQPPAFGQNPTAAWPTPAGQPSGNPLGNFDPKSVSPLDWGIIGAGVAALLFSMFSYYSYSVKINIVGISTGSSSASQSAWHGFFGWFAALVAFAAAGVLAAHLIAKLQLPFPVRLAVLGGFALATLCVLLALIIVPGDTGGASAFGIKIDKGHAFGYWLSLLAILAGTGLSFVRFQQTGGKLPGRT